MHNLRPFPWICQTESADAHHCVHFQFPHNIKQKKQNTDLARTNIIHQFKVSHSDGGDRQIGK
jgi:hypothetical protein